MAKKHNTTLAKEQSEREMLGLIGNKFGRLVVIGFERRGPKNGFVTECECGNRHWVEKWFLLKGKTKSCGCLVREQALNLKTINATHGLTNTRAFKIWSQMKYRCQAPRSDSYSNYGARGISVCERWKSSFADFLSDMGNPPSEKYSLDRINNDGNYEAGNCRWATSQQQTRNTRYNVIVTAFGESKPAIAWSEDPRCKVGKGTLYGRIRRGWSGESAITRAAGNNGRKKSDAVVWVSA